jgi:hypothetical protein
MTTTSATSSSGLGDTTVPNLAFHDGYGIFSLLKVGCSPLGKAKRKATALQDLRGIARYFGNANGQSLVEVVPA